MTRITPTNGNTGIVPPWLTKPPVIVLPVEPHAAARPFQSGAIVESVVAGVGTYVALVDRAHALVRFDRTGMDRVPVASLTAYVGEVER